MQDSLIALRHILQATGLHAKKLAIESGLTPSQWAVLQLLDETRARSIGAIAAHIGLSQATVTTTVDGLERLGLVERRRSADDRRKVYVHPTDKGHALLRTAPRALHNQLTAAFDHMDAWERLQVNAVLKRLTHMLEATSAEGNTGRPRTTTMKP
jgi:DNA-binding MarR family transcriptional regulator